MPSVSPIRPSTVYLRWSVGQPRTSVNVRQGCGRAVDSLAWSELLAANTRAPPSRRARGSGGRSQEPVGGLRSFAREAANAGVTSSICSMGVNTPSLITPRVGPIGDRAVEGSTFE
jgi:hypothetical protein